VNASSKPVSRETPPTPAAAAGVFSLRLGLAEQYAGMLAGAGIDRGLLGPREVPRLWERHLLNCAVLTDAMPSAVDVCDVGSGAGLPGIPLAIRQPDLRVTLLEPLLRRATFLTEVVEELALDNVDVLRARAEDLHGRRTFDVVTSRAVAPLPQLLRWSLPLTRPGGQVLAMKGSSAKEELEASRRLLGQLGGGEPDVVTIGTNVLDFPTTAVRVLSLR
jgi:16S rRNA (guanine527-N7)-methyltransferase